MQGETIITKSDNGLIELTNYKIRLQSESFGQSEIVSILLTEVSAIQVHFKSYVPAFIAGILFLLVGIGMGAGSAGGPFLLFFLLGVALLIYYFYTRKHVVSVVSRSGLSLDFESKGMRRDAMKKFINQIEEAKFSLENSKL